MADRFVVIQERIGRFDWGGEDAVLREGSELAVGGKRELGQPQSVNSAE